MRCLLCGTVLTEDTFADFFREKDVICPDCRREWKRIERRGRFQGIPSYMLYEYNEAFSSCLIQFKECRDEALKPVFLYPDRNRLKKRFRGRTLLLLPSSEQKVRERGFSHLREMFEILNLPMLEPFEKRKELTQKKAGRRERSAMMENIVLKPGVRLPKKAVLADDVITTGATMKGALACLPKGMDLLIFACAAVKDRQESRRKGKAAAFPWIETL